MSWPNLLCVPQNTTFPPPPPKEKDHRRDNQSSARACKSHHNSRQNLDRRATPIGPPSPHPTTTSSTASCKGAATTTTSKHRRPHCPGGISSPSDTVFPRAVWGCPPVRPNSSDHRPLSCPSTRSRLSNLEPRVPPSVSVIAAGSRGRDLCRTCPLWPSDDTAASPVPNRSDVGIGALSRGPPVTLSMTAFAPKRWDLASRLLRCAAGRRAS